MADKTQMYHAWLRDAHAMEEALIIMLEKQIQETEHKPEIQMRLKAHLEETKEQSKKLESCLKRHGEDTSVTKDALAKFTSAIDGFFMSMPHDSLVKHAMSSYAAEHFEIASYTALIVTANDLGDTETARVCSEILNQEIAMANWLSEQLPNVVKEHMKEMDAEQTGSSRSSVGMSSESFARRA